MHSTLIQDAVLRNLRFHYIFPKAVLKKAFTARETDDIANLAFIGGTTNRAISDKAPLDSFPPLTAKVGHAPFAAQCIPIASTLLQVETYKVFLAQRRTMIAERLNVFLYIILCHRSLGAMYWRLQ
jgi:hypothetical protein